MIKKNDEKKGEGRFDLGLGGILKGFGDLVEKLGELSETGEQLSRNGEIHGAGKEVKGIYGFTVKVGLGDDRPRIEPFGNIRKDRESGRSVVQEVREPVVDVFEEDDHVLIVAEMPGISVEDVQLTVEDDLLIVYCSAWREAVPQRGTTIFQLCSREDAGHLQQRSGGNQVREVRK